MAQLNEKLLEFKFKKLHTQAQQPTKDNGDIGWDFYCVEDENFKEIYNGLGQTSKKICVELPPGSRYIFQTGISIELPEGYHGVIKPRSGLAVKKGINILAGIIDEAYRGPLMICLHNTGNKTVKICAGDKIAQMIIIKENEGYWEEVKELSDTNRGQKGFGSSDSLL